MNNTGSTYVLTGDANFLAVSGANNLVFVMGDGDATIQGNGRELTVDIIRPGSVMISGFKGVIGLDPSFGFAHAQDAFKHVTSDGHGGSLLSYTGGSVDLVGIPKSHLGAGNFHVDNFSMAPFSGGR